jgi:cupin 2 domain-containing protein
MNLYDYITPQNGETFTTLLEHKNIKINRIVSSSHLDEAEYIQEEDEWLVLVEGGATLLLDQTMKTLTKGDTLFIPSKTRHRVLNTQNGTIWLTVHIF